ncbi:MAG TPA: exopolysaccharide biosynthesis protein, partial [Caulobacteraceae bacterium]|nr:exopolysaccharide biosynthesis protein [Caulobacteraceae bacterium]
MAKARARRAPRAPAKSTAAPQRARRRKTSAGGPAKDSMAARLKPLLRKGGERIKLCEMVERIDGDEGPGPVLFVLTLPVLLPLPPGVSMVMALPILLVAPQI